MSASEGIKKGETVTVTVTPNVGYELDTLTVKTENKEVETKKVSETSYTFAMPAANVTVTAKFKASALKVVDIDKVTLTEDTFGNDWHINFSEPSDYVENVTGFKVNGISWEEKSYNISSGGAYRKYADDNYIQIAQKSYSASENEVPVRSGDVITISAKGYEDLNLKFVVDASGKASLVADDGEGDPYELHVKIEGSFEAAIVGQKDYDGVSGASTGGSTSNNNSNVTVYGALVEKDKEPTDDDWQKLDNNSQIDLNGSKCKVSIVPDVESGTPEDADSGMSGVYMPISSDLTLSGTPKDAGKYLVSVSIEDKQGRKATSNTLPFMIYTGEETLAEQIKTENLKQYACFNAAFIRAEGFAVQHLRLRIAGSCGSNVEIRAGNSLGEIRKIVRAEAGFFHENDIFRAERRLSNLRKALRSRTVVHKGRISIGHFHRGCRAKCGGSALRDFFHLGFYKIARCEIQRANGAAHFNGAGDDVFLCSAVDRSKRYDQRRGGRAEPA